MLVGVTWWGEMFSVEPSEGKEERFRICDFLSTHTSKVSTDEALPIPSGNLFQYLATYSELMLV